MSMDTSYSSMTGHEYSLFAFWGHFYSFSLFFSGFPCYSPNFSENSLSPILTLTVATLLYLIDLGSFFSVYIRRNLYWILHLLLEKIDPHIFSFRGNIFYCQCPDSLCRGKSKVHMLFVEGLELFISLQIWQELGWVPRHYIRDPALPQYKSYFCMITLRLA